MRGMDIEYHIFLLESRKYLKFGKSFAGFGRTGRREGSEPRGLLVAPNLAPMTARLRLGKESLVRWWGS
jgi:hypothetical protein